MNRKPSHLLGALILTLMTPPLYAQSKSEAPYPRYEGQTISRAAPSSSELSFDLALGSGQYPILELPMMENSDARIDGSTSEHDWRVNTGVLLDLHLGWTSKYSAVPYKLSLGAQRMSSPPGGGLPTASSYTRLNAELGTPTHFESTGTTLTPGIETRRDMYRNVDSGHYVDAILIKGNVDQSVTNSITWGIGGAVAPWTRFGLLQNSDRGPSGALNHSTASVSEVSTRIIWTPEATTSFHISAAQESVTARLTDNDGYQNYGLPVASSGDGRGERTYDLSVRQVSIGSSKRF